ncbi:RNase H family protein [Glutamicibacter creatinolyticus]|uniref:RNase H family protein n=1 Tax=Glutamicibacter creatinolyticus TaxID=162496 RepID=UPI0037C01F15
MTIIAAADGSALGNPGPAGWAWYIDEQNWAAGGWDHGTNNMGELQAVLELFRATEHLADEELRILCDSQYAINCISKWMPGWKKRGWKKADGKPVMNQEILKELDAAIQNRSYTFEWVRGHAGHELNEAADERARAAATAHQRSAPVPHGPGFTRDAAPGSAAAATTAAAAEPRTTAKTEAETGAGQSAPVHTGSHAAAPGELAASGQAEPAGAETTAMVFGLERGMLDGKVRTSFEEFVDFLHPGYQEVSRHGGLLDVATVQQVLDSGQRLPATGPTQLLTAHALADDLVLLAYRMKPADGSATLVCSSWWQHTKQGWKLRFRQETAEQPR